MVREKKPSRLQWFALDVDAFLDDPRMQHLTTSEKALWALLLIKSFRNGGTIITKPEIIAEQTGCPVKTAKLLLATLYRVKLIIPIEGEIYEAISNRMSKEWNIAKAAYDRHSNAGKASAEARLERYGTAQPSNTCSNDDRTE